MSETMAYLIWCVALLAIDLLLAASRSALVNSQQEVLRRREEVGVPGARLALRVSSNATSLMSSLRAGQATLRLAIMGLALALGSLWVPVEAPRWLLAMVAVTVGAGLLVRVLEFILENLALRQAERWALQLAPFGAAAVWVFSPLGWVMRRTAHLLAGPRSGPRHPLVTEEAIMTMVDAGEEGGVIEQEEKEMIYSIFQLGDTLAREVMVPRIDILGFDKSSTISGTTDALLKAGHSRAPVYDGTIDNIVGLVYVKDLLAALREGKDSGNVTELLREPYFVPEAKKADDLLAEMQTRRMHMAVVVDEYGGTAGVVTIEDIVEEIVGEILDEYDEAEELPMQRVEEGVFIFSGRISLDDVNEVLGARLPKDIGDTLGGLIFNRLGRVPAVGEAVEVGGLRLVVEQVAGRRIRSVRASRLPDPEPRSRARGNHT
jgi:putative hemolysin